MSDSHEPATPPHEIPEPTPAPLASADAATFAVTFTGAPERNTMRLEGEGELTFDGGDVIVEALQRPSGAPPRRIRFMFALAEIARIGLHEGALAMAVAPRSDPGKTYVISFYVGSEEDAHRVMAILHGRHEPAGSSGWSSEIERFYARMRRGSALGMHSLLAANLAVFALMVLTGASITNPDNEILVKWGARFNMLIHQGQWWRIATPMFVHAGLIHLAFNMWALKVLGDFVERLYGSARFLLVYFGAGLAGNAASYFMKPDDVAAGASGAIFGILGALVGFLLRRRHAIPRPIMTQMRNSSLSMIGINLLIGMSIPQVDNSAHIGGLISGFLLGWLLAPAQDSAEENEDAPPRISQMRQRVYAAVLALVFTGLMALGYQATSPRLERMLLSETAVQELNDQLVRRYGSSAPECRRMEVGRQLGAHRYAAQALMSDGSRMQLTLRVHKDPANQDEHVLLEFPESGAPRL